MGDALTQYEHDWRRMLWDATGDQTKVDRIIELAHLNGLFDPVKAILGRPAPSPMVKAEVARAYFDPNGQQWLFCNRWEGYADAGDDICDCDVGTGCKDMQALLGDERGDGK